MMIRISALLLLVLVSSCGTSQKCLGIAQCGPGDVEVSSCSGQQEECRTVRMCGTVAHCLVGPLCESYPECAPGEIEVNGCTDDVEDCRLVTTCGATIACAPGGIAASNYDQSCASAVDCEVVYEGDLCECKVCHDAAINVSAVADYESDVSSIVCEPPMACPDVECMDAIRPFCRAGTCTAEPAPIARATDFDQSCDTVDDCAAVYEGDVCAACQCPNAAINVNEREAYQEQFDPDCAVPSPCDCGEPPIACNDGICEISE